MSDPRAALDAIGSLPDVEIDIAAAAMQLARIDAPDADWRAAEEHLSEIARQAVALARDLATDTPSIRAESLTGLVALRHGYRGDAETYDDPANANLIRVIERRKGLPVALGIIWLHAARAAGWAAHGLDFPGHFLLAFAGKGAQAVIDVFGGGTPLDSRDLRQLIKRVEGPDAELRPGILQPMNARHVLLRLQNNIKLRRLQAGNIAGAIACTRDMLRVAPDAAALWREAATLHQHADDFGAALECYERFVTLVPKGAAAERAREAISQLRNRLH
jgi:regulator of sirC expression with transglutaminase-like and TPR domain